MWRDGEQGWVTLAAPSWSSQTAPNACWRAESCCRMKSWPYGRWWTVNSQEGSWKYWLRGSCWKRWRDGLAAGCGRASVLEAMVPKDWLSHQYSLAGMDVKELFLIWKSNPSAGPTLESCAQCLVVLFDIFCPPLTGAAAGSTNTPS